MKAKYKIFNQYITGEYCGFDVGYLPLKTGKAYLLICSQINEKHSEKMKKLRKDRKQTKDFYDMRHRVRQQRRRVLRESKKGFKNLIYLFGVQNENTQSF